MTDPQRTYFPCDPHHPALAQHIAQAVAAGLAAQPETRVYALMDATGLDRHWARQLWTESQHDPHRIQPLYQDTPLADLEECAPFLCTLDRRELPALLSKTRSLPVLSVIQSRLDLDALRRHLARFVQVRAPDGASFAARWGFALGVPALVAALDPPCRALLLSGVDAWHLVNRSGTLDTLAGSGEAPPTDPVPGMSDNAVEISEQAFLALADAFEADALLVAEARRSPALVQGRQPSVLHAMASRVLKEMDRLQLTEAPLRSELLCEALACASAEAAFAQLAVRARQG
ncbi:MAG: DUF4123 domain-containing protein [Haliea sp.]|nr:MAG: DUF4123 domain-containing protein [Haliea sp.]